MTIHGKLEPYTREIRERYAAGNVTQEDLAWEYGCSQNSISAVVRDLVYQDRHVDRYRAETKCQECGEVWSWWRYPARMQAVYRRCAACAERAWRKRKR